MILIKNLRNVLIFQPSNPNTHEFIPRQQNERGPRTLFTECAAPVTEERLQKYLLDRSGALPLRKGVGGYGGFSRGVKLWAVRGITGVGGHASSTSTVQLPPWQRLLAPSTLFEAETTRGCAEAGC